MIKPKEAFFKKIWLGIFGTYGDAEKGISPNSLVVGPDYQSGQHILRC